MNFNKPSEILIAAKAVIADPKHWTKGAIAKNSDGYSTYVSSETASCWCSVGAYYRVAEAIDETPIAITAFETLTRAATAFGRFLSVADMNDASDHATVMSVWDKAIELAKEAETV